MVTDDNGQFSTSSDWASHKHNTNAGKTSEDGVWFGTSKPDDSKGALPYDTYIIEEMRCDSMSIVVIGIYLGFKREFSKLIGFLVVALIAVGLVFNAGGVKDVLLELFNKIIGA